MELTSQDCLAAGASTAQEPIQLGQGLTMRLMTPFRKTVTVNRLVEDTPHWFEQYSLEDIRKAQEEDPELQMIRQYLESGIEPNEAELFLQNRATKNYWINRKLLIWEEEIIDG